MTCGFPCPQGARAVKWGDEAPAPGFGAGRARLPERRLPESFCEPRCLSPSPGAAGKARVFKNKMTGGIMKWGLFSEDNANSEA